MRKVSFVCMLLVLWNFTACSFWRDYLTKEEIFELVLENEEWLFTLVQSGTAAQAESLDERIKVNIEDGYVDFYCGGRGLSVSGMEFGFYYSPEDQPLRYASYTGYGEPLLPQGDGWYLGSESRTEGDRYYTEKICDCFYYYESSF